MSTTTVTIREGESTRYGVKLSAPPIAPQDPDEDPNWWVMPHIRLIMVDGDRVDEEFQRRPDGHGRISLVPSIGRQFNGSNWSAYKYFTIAADDDFIGDSTFEFIHEVWDHDAECPIHSVAKVTVHVRDNDEDDSTSGLPMLEIDDVTVAEDAGPARFTVRLNKESDETVTVEYATSNGSAAAGDDWNADVCCSKSDEDDFG